MAAHRLGDHAGSRSESYGLRFIAAPASDRPVVLQRWMVRIGVAVFFIAIGIEKFGPHSPWIRTFARIGLGQWFRTLTGVMQVAGAVLVLIPRLSLVGIAMIACTMAGAVIVNLLVLHTGAGFLIPAVLLGGLIAAGLCLRSTT